MAMLMANGSISERHTATDDSVQFQPLQKRLETITHENWQILEILKCS